MDITISPQGKYMIYQCFGYEIRIRMDPNPDPDLAAMKLTLPSTKAFLFLQIDISINNLKHNLLPELEQHP